MSGGGLQVHRSRGYLNTEGLKLVIEQGLPEEATDRDIAMQVRVALERHYPDHPWSVTFSGHALVVRHGPATWWATTSITGSTPPSTQAL